MAIVLTPITNQLQTVFTDRERLLIHRLRVLLKDLPNDVMLSLNTLVESHRSERWSDDQLLVYLQQAVGDINATPPHTVFSLDNVPDSLISTVALGGMVFSLIAEGILQNGENFSYSDNGISLNINLSQGYLSAAGTLLNAYTQQKAEIKKAMRPNAAGIKSSPAAVRIRSYSPRMWTTR